MSSDSLTQQETRTTGSGLGLHTRSLNDEGN
jgi:hypothetical protein